jgi:predicted DNA-binding protein with PD1-like motif
VIAGEARHTRCVMGRLERGEPVVEALAELARFERIDAGFVRGQGAVEAPALARFDPAERRYVPAPPPGPGPWELVSLAGNVSLRGGGAEVRLWAVLAGGGADEPRLAAGLLQGARALYVEFAIDVCDDADLERRDDPVTGLPLWRPPRRR